MNDITLEHGRNTGGHTAEHLRGDAVDIYHPGYSALGVTVEANGSPSQLGGTFMNTTVQTLLTRARAAIDTPDRAAARDDLATWIYAARNDMETMLSRMFRGNSLDKTGLYLKSYGQGFPGDVRQLLWEGKCTYANPLDLSKHEVMGNDGLLIELGNWKPDEDEARNLAYRNAIEVDNKGGHNDHIHIRPLGKLSNF